MALKQNCVKRLLEFGSTGTGLKIGGVFGSFMTDYATNKVFAKRLFYCWNSFGQQNYLKPRLISFTVKN